MHWTEDQLQPLPQHNGFRLRGLEMTRLEAFTDAAFAFATTMLVISLSGIPNSVSDLTSALRDTPAFLASFGLEDGLSTLISLTLVFVMLLYVYPLKMIFSAMFAWISGGWLPTSFSLTSTSELLTLFIVYGVGFCAVNTLMGLLYSRAMRAADALALNAVERVWTRHGVVSFAVMAATGLGSSVVAWLLPPQLAVWAGFCYATLPIIMPLVARAHHRMAQRQPGSD